MSFLGAQRCWKSLSSAWWRDWSLAGFSCRLLISQQQCPCACCSSPLGAPPSALRCACSPTRSRSPEESRACFEAMHTQEAQDLANQGNCDSLDVTSPQLTLACMLACFVSVLAHWQVDHLIPIFEAVDGQTLE